MNRHRMTCRGPCALEMPATARYFERDNVSRFLRTTCRWCAAGKKRRILPRPAATEPGVCRRCGERKPLDKDHFRKIIPHFARNPAPTFSRTCRACEEKPWRAAQKAWNDKQAAARAVTITCKTCGKTKPATKEYFIVVRGRLHSPCRPCRHRVEMERAQTPAAKRTQRRYQRSEAAKEAQRRYLAKNAVKVKMARMKRIPTETAHREIYRAVKRGEIVKPDRCSLCRRKRRIYARCDITRPLETVRWLCRCCLLLAIHGQDIGELVERAREKVAKKTAKRYRVQFEVADRLTIEPDMFARFHALHVEQIAKEKAREAEREAREGPTASERERQFRKRRNFLEATYTGNVEAQLRREGWFRDGPVPECVLGHWMMPEYA